MRTLVIGRGGLIGSSLETALFKRFGHVQAQQKIYWDDPIRALVVAIITLSSLLIACIVIVFLNIKKQKVD